MKYTALDCYKQDHATMIATDTGEIQEEVPLGVSSSLAYRLAQIDKPSIL